MSDETVPITEEWLKVIGFRWAEWERSGGKHWIIWFGRCRDEREMLMADEDLGIELCSVVPGEPGQWYCWLRSDFAHKYTRFIHIRHLRFQHELIAIIVALSGVPWNPERHLYGAIHNKKTAEYLIKSEVRLDRIITKLQAWSEQEKDESKARLSDFGVDSKGESI